MFHVNHPISNILDKHIELCYEDVVEYKFLTLINRETQITIHPVIVYTENELILCDTGYKNQLTQIEEELNKYDFTIKDITKIVITHHDHDHVGSLKSIRNKNENIEIISSEIESEYINGNKLPLRLLNSENIVNTLTGKERKFTLMFINYLKTIEACTVDKHVKVSEYIISGLKVISTVGHSPGHISLLLEDNKTLIAGDAIIIENNNLIKQSYDIIFDRDEYYKSIRNIIKLNPGKIICYHGGIIDNENIRLEELLK